MISEVNAPDFIPPPVKDQSVEQVAKLRQEKKELEDDIKRLKLMAFKLKSELAFASTTTSAAETTSSCSTESIVVNHVFPKKKSAFPSLSSQISIGKKNFPRMAMKELNHSDTEDSSVAAACDFDLSEYDKRRSSGRFYTKEGPEPIVTESMKQRQAAIHDSETAADAIRRSSETASSTVKLFNQNLNSFKNKLKQGYSSYIWEGEHVIKIPVIIKLDTKSESIYFQQSELLFGFFPKHDIPPVKIADICEIMAGADINVEERSPLSSSTAKPTASAAQGYKTTDFELSTNNDDGGMPFAGNPTTFTDNGSEVMSAAINPLMRGSQIRTAAIPSIDYERNLPLANSNITSSDKSQHSSHNVDKNCLLSIVSKSDGNLDARRIAFQLPITEDRNALLTGIRTLVSELHMVHMNALPEHLLRLTGGAGGSRQDSLSRLANFRNSRQINIPHSLGQQIKNKNLIINVDGGETVRDDEVRSSIISCSSGTSDFSSTTDEGGGPLTPIDYCHRGSMNSANSESFFKFDGKDGHTHISDKVFTGSVADILTHKQQTSYEGVVASVTSPRATSAAPIGHRSLSMYSSGITSTNSGGGNGTSRSASVQYDGRDDAEGHAVGFNIERVNREKMFIQVSSKLY